MTDSKGPYRVENVGDNGFHLVGPCDTWRLREPRQIHTDDVATVANLAHHTARREAIEACIATMEAEAARRFPLGMDSCVPLRGACWYMVDAVRALLGAGEKEENDETT